MDELFDFFIKSLPYIGTIFTLVLGSFLGYKFSNRQYKNQKQIEYIQNQISNFYSPMLALRKEISAKSLLRVTIHHESETAWAEECKIGFKNDDIQNKMFEPYEKLIDYDNEQLHKELIPKYKKMFNIFNKYYWLAEPETAKWYDKLHNFIEIRSRFDKKSLPKKVIKNLDFEEKHLYGFYSELEFRMNELKNKLK